MATQKIAVGQWGGLDGNVWDDGFFTGLQQIKISYGNAIGNFQAIYDRDGKSYDGPVHESGIVFPNNETITLGLPNERIVCVSGYIGPLASNANVIRSLTFQTNVKTYGPYGADHSAEDGSTPFNLPIRSGKIVGFNGSTGPALTSIGFNLGN